MFTQINNTLMDNNKEWRKQLEIVKEFPVVVQLRKVLCCRRNNKRRWTTLTVTVTLI